MRNIRRNDDDSDQTQTCHYTSCCSAPRNIREHIIAQCRVARRAGVLRPRRRQLLNKLGGGRASCIIDSHDRHRPIYWPIIGASRPASTSGVRSDKRASHGGVERACSLGRTDRRILLLAGHHPTSSRAMRRDYCVISASASALLDTPIHSVVISSISSTASSTRLIALTALYDIALLPVTGLHP